MQFFLPMQGNIRTKVHIKDDRLRVFQCDNERDPNAWVPVAPTPEISVFICNKLLHLSGCNDERLKARYHELKNLIHRIHDGESNNDN